MLSSPVGVEPGQPDGMPTRLGGQVVNELVRRGVRALEAFGRTAEAVEIGTADFVGVDSDPNIQTAITALGDCAFDRCVIDAGFLLDAGFTVVAPHRYFPRLRLELDKGLGWKAEVEAALERLLEGARLEQVV